MWNLVGGMQVKKYYIRFAGKGKRAAQMQM